MDKQIFFRVDGGSKIGLGHLVRCMALAQMLMNEYLISFFCEEIPKRIESEIIHLGFQLFKIENENQLLNQLKNSDIVVLDHYKLGSDYQKQIKNRGTKLVCIDDLSNHLFYADLIINHAPNVHKNQYKAQTYTKYALGIDYVLLRPVFLNKAKKQRRIEKINTIFICFGGADPKNLTLKILQICSSIKGKKIIVATGTSYSHLENLNKFLSDNQDIYYQHDISEDEMAFLMESSDLAIIPASGILFEAIALGCVSITSAYVDNQKAILEGFKKHNSVNFIDSFDDFTLDFLNNFLENYQFKAINRQIDGNSNFRIKQLINQL